MPNLATPSRLEAEERKEFLQMARLHPNVAEVWEHEASKSGIRGRRHSFALKSHPDIMGMLKGGRLFGPEFKRPGAPKNEQKKRQDEQDALRLRFVEGGAFMFKVNSAKDGIKMLNAEPGLYPFIFQLPPEFAPEGKPELVWAMVAEDLHEAWADIAGVEAGRFELSVRIKTSSLRFSVYSNRVWGEHARTIPRYVLPIEKSS